MKHDEHDDPAEEYLWDPASRPDAPDPLVQRLERALAKHRYGGRPARARRWLPFAAAAALVLVLFGLWRLLWSGPEVDRGASYVVSGLAGVERVHAGDSFVVGGETAGVEVAALGRVTFQPGSRVRVVDCGEQAHRMDMDQGNLHAFIDAKPRLFQVGTPAGLTVDLGCEYELSVDKDGTARLHVLMGRVAFETGGRKVVVPGYTSIETPKGGRPTTPVADDADSKFVRAVRAIEFAEHPDPADVERVLATDRREDSVTLVQLFDAPSAVVREGAYDVISRWYPAPPGVTREGTLAGDEAMNAAWREACHKDWYY